MNSPYATWQQFQRPPADIPQLPGPQTAAPAPTTLAQPRPQQGMFGGNPFAPQTGNPSGGWPGGNGGGFGGMFNRLFSGFGGQQNAPAFGNWGFFGRGQANGQTPMPNTAPSTPWYMGGMGHAPRWGQQPQQAPQPAVQPAPQAPLDAGVNQYQPYAQSHMAPDLGVTRAFARGGLACKCGGGA